MVLKANRYPDSWVFSNETPAPPPDYPKTDKARVFLDVFLTPQHFKKIVLWRYPEYAGTSYFLDKECDYRVIDYLPEAEEIRYGIEDLTLKGHLSVMYVPLNSTEFLRRILSAGHYGNPEQITVGDESDKDPLDWEYGQNIGFLELDIFTETDHIFTFFHDVQFMYEILK